MRIKFCTKFSWFIFSIWLAVGTQAIPLANAGYFDEAGVSDDFDTKQIYASPVIISDHAQPHLKDYVAAELPKISEKKWMVVEYIDDTLHPEKTFRTTEIKFAGNTLHSKLTTFEDSFKPEIRYGNMSISSTTFKVDPESKTIKCSNCDSRIQKAIIEGNTVEVKSCHDEITEIAGTALNDFMQTATWRLLTNKTHQLMNRYLEKDSPAKTYPFSIIVGGPFRGAASDLIHHDGVDLIANGYIATHAPNILYPQFIPTQKVEILIDENAKSLFEPYQSIADFMYWNIASGPVLHMDSKLKQPEQSKRLVMNVLVKLSNEATSALYQSGNYNAFMEELVPDYKYRL